MQTVLRHMVPSMRYMRQCPVLHARPSGYPFRFATKAVSATGAGPGVKPAWEIRMLYDGDCPLCMKEVGFLKSRDAGKGRIDFVDIAAPSYSPADNAGITYEQAMDRIHAIMADGHIITDIEVFRRLYEAVGLGWVYAITANPTIEKAANAVYGVWAKYRTQLTGRTALSIILEKRQQAQLAADGKLAGSTCAAAAAACEAKVSSGSSAK